MKYPFVILFFFICVTAMGCSKGSGGNPGKGSPGPVTGIPVHRRPASIGVIGDTTNVIRTVNGGLVLMGGGTDVAPALKWMMDRSGGGDVVIHKGFRHRCLQFLH